MSYIPLIVYYKYTYLIFKMYITNTFYPYKKLINYILHTYFIHLIILINNTLHLNYINIIIHYLKYMNKYILIYSKCIPLYSNTYTYIVKGGGRKPI